MAEMITRETRLEQVMQAFEQVAGEQRRDVDPSHEDFYVWGWALSELTYRVQDAAGVLGRQVSSYSDRRILRDDEGVDPSARLVEACGHLEELRAALGHANEAARRYHSSIGHVAVVVDPEGAL